MQVTIEKNGRRICWSYQGRQICKQYGHTLLGYECLPDDTGILVLEPHQEAGSNNAVIFNADGSERWRLPYTKKSGEGIFFDRVGVTQGKLKVIAIVGNRDVGFVVDWINCCYLSISAAR